MYIKQEANSLEVNPPPTLDSIMEKLREDICLAREGNNAQDNCDELTGHIIQLLNHYVSFAPKPIEQPSCASTSSSINTELLIKTENNQKIVCQASALRTTHGLNAYLPNHVDIEQHDLINQVVRKITLIEPSQLPKKMVDLQTDDLNQRLMQEAGSAARGIAYGHIGLAQKDTRKPGHVFAFVANAMEVIYIDAQLYDGITKTGNPFFHSIKSTYPFLQSTVSTRHKSFAFQTRCFYLLHSESAPEVLPFSQSHSNQTFFKPKKRSKSNHRSQKTLVYANNGETAFLTGDELRKARKDKSVITLETYNYRHQFVYASNGEVALLAEPEHTRALNNGTVITIVAYKSRQLVYADSGERAFLTGDALINAQNDGSVIPRSTYRQRKFVYASNGEVALLTDDELKKARGDGSVITESLYKSRQPVDVITGERVLLTDDQRREAEKNGSIMKKSQFSYRYLAEKRKKNSEENQSEIDQSPAHKVYTSTTFH